MALSQIERIARSEVRLDNVEEKLDDVGADIKSIAADTLAMREMLARYQGASSVAKYITHTLVGTIGVVAGWFGLKH